MTVQGIKYYILFENYTQGLALYESLNNNRLKARIAPTPRAVQGELSCGMSLLVESDEIEAVKAYLKDSRAVYHRIAALEDQIRPGRDRFC